MTMANIQFELGTASGVPQPNSCVQVDRLLSATQHKLYRQHMTYTCKLNLMTNSSAVDEIEVYTLMPSWYVMGSIKAAKRIHDQVMKEERSEAGQARWYDFRIEQDLFQTEELEAAGLAQDGSATYVGVTGGEYLYSQIQDANGNNKTFAIRQASSTARYNIFEEYDAMGNVSADPETPASGGYDDAMAEMETANIDDLLTRGNLPPYNPNTWDAVWIKVGSLYQSSAGNSRLTTGFFEAPLGLIYLPGYVCTSNILQLEVASGNYKGVKAVSC